ncbi:MAG: hypothetical protein Q9226_006621 [Calogaya cf. arnoldii]
MANPPSPHEVTILLKQDRSKVEAMLKQARSTPFTTVELPHAGSLLLNEYAEMLKTGIPNHPYHLSIDTLIPSHDEETLRLRMIEISFTKRMSTSYSGHLMVGAMRLSALIQKNPQWAMGTTFLKTVEELRKKSQEWTAMLNDLERRLILKPFDFPEDGSQLSRQEACLTSDFLPVVPASSNTMADISHDQESHRIAIDSCKDVESLQNLRPHYQQIKNPPIPSINTLIPSSNFYTLRLTAQEIKHCMPLIESYIDLPDERVQDISQLVAQNPQSPLMSNFAAMVESLRYKSYQWRMALIEVQHRLFLTPSRFDSGGLTGSWSLLALSHGEALARDGRELRRGKIVRDQAEKQLAESDGVVEDTAEDASEGTSKEGGVGGLQDASH